MSLQTVASRTMMDYMRTLKSQISLYERHHHVQKARRFTGRVILKGKLIKMKSYCTEFKEENKQMVTMVTWLDEALDKLR